MIQKITEKIGQLECVIVNETELKGPKAAVILCHGFGAPATDLVSLGNEFVAADPTLAQAVYIFPGAPLELDPMFDARAWWMIDMENIQQLMVSGQTREMRNESPDRLPLCRKMIFELIDHVKAKYSLDATRIVVGGFSQGAMLGTDVALHYPETLGGLIVWSGALINEPEWSERAKKKSALQIVQTHGSIDPILPPAGAKLLNEMLSGAGHKVDFHQFQGPHTIPMEGLQMAARLIGDVINA